MKQLVLLAAFIFSAAIIQAQSKTSQYKFNGEQSVFTENKGQVVDQNGNAVPDVLAKASMPGLDMYLTKTGVTYVLLQYTEDLTAKPHPVFINDKKFKVTYSRVDVALTGAQITSAQAQLTNAAGWQSNYYKTADAKGQLAVSHFKNLTVQNVYPGIDWVWKFNAAGNLEYEFVVHPGADPSLIKMQYSYADIKASINSMSINTRNGSILEGPLMANDGKGNVPVIYSLNAANKEVSFKPSAYDNTKDLVIDPPLALNWSAQYGGSFLNGLRGVTTDNSGGVYLCGFTTSSDFPVINPHITGEYYDSTYNGQSDAIILKLDTNQTLKYATFLGGPGNDFANSICFGSSGNFSSVFITGGAQSGFPIHYGNNTCTGQDAFVTGLQLPFFNLIYSSYYGGSGTDEGLKICITQNTQSVYVVGYTNSVNNSFAGLNNGGYYQTPVVGQEAFITRLNYNINGGVVINNWNTKFGGSGDDYATSVTTDSLNNVIVCGYTNSTNIPLLQSDSAYYQSTNAGGYDGFIAKFSANSALLNSTYYGGSGDDYFNDVATGLNGSLAFTGRTNSSNFPLRAIGGFGYNQAHLADATDDAFIINAANNLTVKWATYFGGAAADVGTGISTDAGGQLYVCGFTFSQNFPVHSFAGAYNQPTNHGNSDAFIARFNEQGVQNWTTYKGDSCYQYPYSIAYDKVFNKFYVAGQGLLDCLGDTSGQSLPDTGQVHNGVSSVGFAWSFNGQNNSPPLCNGFSVGINYLVQPCTNICNGVAKVVITGGRSPYSIIWSDGGMLVTDSALCPQEGWVEVKDSLGCVAETDLQFTPVSIDFFSEPIVCNTDGGDIEATAVGGTGNAYQFQWSHGGVPFSYVVFGNTSEQGEQITDTGMYYITVTDARGCTVTGGVDMTYYNDTTMGELTVNRYPDCTGNGVIDFAFPEGSYPDFLQYPKIYWEDFGYNILATGEEFDNLRFGQIYWVVDSNRCYNGLLAPVKYDIALNDALEITGLDAINPPSSCIAKDGHAVAYYNTFLNSSEDVIYGLSADNSFANGSVTLFDFPNLTYLWSNGETTANVYDLGNGPFSVTVSEPGGCSVVYRDSFNVAGAIMITMSDSGITCKPGWAQALANGGTMPYQYEWSGGETSTSITITTPQQIFVDVTDASGCFTSATAYIDYNNNDTVTYSFNCLQYPSCNGTGTVVINAPQDSSHIYWVNSLNVVSRGDTFSQFTRLSNNLFVVDSGHCFNGQPIIYQIIPTTFFFCWRTISIHKSIRL